MESGACDKTCGLKMPCGETSGTRCPSNVNPRASNARGSTSPTLSTCALNHSKAAFRTAASRARRTCQLHGNWIAENPLAGGNLRQVRPPRVRFRPRTPAATAMLGNVVRTSFPGLPVFQEVDAEAAGQAASRRRLRSRFWQLDAMQVGGQYRQCDGAREAVRAMAADTVEPVFQPIDGRLDCRMRTPRGREGFLRLPFAVGSGKIPLCRQYVEVEQRVELDSVVRAVKAPVEAARPQLGMLTIGAATSTSSPSHRILWCRMN